MEEDVSYGEINHIQIDRELFQFQKTEFEDETVFMLSRSGELICVIMLDENNEWQPDSEMEKDKFNQVIGWINKLYF